MNQVKAFLFQDAKYFLALLFPAVFFLSLYLGPSYYALMAIVAFVILPLMEIVFPRYTTNVDTSLEPYRAKLWIFDLLLYSNVLIVYIALGCGLFLFSDPSIGIFTKSILAVSLGIILSTSGINVAHELGHRNSKFEKILASLLLLPSFYMHFTIEHNYGHHLLVATPKDPATARKNETVYAFWFRSIYNVFLSSIKIESTLMKKENRDFNRIYIYLFIEVVYIALIYIFFGPMALLMAIVAGVVSLLLLESINYIEHYGIVRKQNGSGKYESVKPKHSWNSNHSLGRIVLYELTRHSDHHFKSTRKFQNLRHLDPSPQLLTGYPGSIILSLIPPLWFSLMNRRYDQFEASLEKAQ